MRGRLTRLRLTPKLMTAARKAGGARNASALRFLSKVKVRLKVKIEQFEHVVILNLVEPLSYIQRSPNSAEFLQRLDEDTV